MFEKKEGPSEEEVIKNNIVKASQGRRFEKQMKTAMVDESMKGMSPMAIEMALRAKIGNSKVAVKAEEESFEGQGQNDEEYVEEDTGPSASPFRLAQDMASMKVDEAYSTHVTAAEEEQSGWGELVVPVSAGDSGAAADSSDDAANWQEVTDENGHYYWNTVTNDTTYDRPACLDAAAPATSGGAGGQWKMIKEYVNEENVVYYWNTVTNDTTYERPHDYDESEDVADSGVAAEADTGEEEQHDMWTEVTAADGTVSYFKTEDPAHTRSDRPHGTVLIAFEDGTMFQESGHGYKNTDTGEVVTVRPEGGVVMIVETIGGGKGTRWSNHMDDAGNTYWYDSETGTSQYEKPDDV